MEEFRVSFDWILDARRGPRRALWGWRWVVMWFMFKIARMVNFEA